eukprot:SM001677S02992  [mRNA]  locus=s1677:111:1679:+ [translate_table: standard]
MYACAIADILEAFGDVQETVILGDVTYGACCVDDIGAAAAGADFLVHYGHSCLVPIDHTTIPCMYVFVEIGIDVDHLVATVRRNFERGARLMLAGTIQFSAALQAARAALADDFPSLRIPQAKPLSPGEVLGCTAPALPAGDADSIVFVADGRFHLEAIMIANPAMPAYRYDPYARVLTVEKYDQAGMRRARRSAIEKAAPARRWGLVLGTLGRQGNLRTLHYVRRLLDERNLSHIIVLVSELSPAKVASFGSSIEAWVQVACPRLSIDWGEAFAVPLLTPFEATVALGAVRPWWKRHPPNHDHCDGACSDPATRAPAEPKSAGGARGQCCRPGGADELSEAEESVAVYPMDYYARAGGPWNSAYGTAAPSRRQHLAAGAASASTRPP